MTGRSGANAIRLLAGELLPPGDDHVAVERVEFHHPAGAFSLLAADQGAPAASKEVEHGVPAPARAVNGRLLLRICFRALIVIG